MTEERSTPRAPDRVITPGEHAVLVVDDDQAIRRLVSTVLLRKGYTVDTAADGLEAVLKLGVMEFDVIILDLMMPNLDGFTFIETFAQHDPERLRKIVVTSAASIATIRSRTAGLSLRILPKPFDIAQLVAMVEECIRGNDGEGMRDEG